LLLFLQHLPTCLSLPALALRPLLCLPFHPAFPSPPALLSAPCAHLISKCCLAFRLYSHLCHPSFYLVLPWVIQAHTVCGCFVQRSATGYKQHSYGIRLFLCCTCILPSGPRCVAFVPDRFLPLLRRRLGRFWVPSCSAATSCLNRTSG